MDLQQRLELVEAENEMLRARVQDLERALHGGDIALPIEWGLTPSEARVFGVLLTKDRVSKDQMMTAMYGLRSNCDVAAEKICDVYICKLRKKLKRFEVTIHTDWGQGWRLDPRDRAAFRARLTEDTEAKAA